MKALQSIVMGGPETLQLRDVSCPQPAPGELLVSVRACAVNYPDVLMIEDKYQIRPTRPFSLGGEVAGEVLQIGAGVHGFAPGDRVVAMPLFGGMAEAVVTPAARAYAIPESMPIDDAAALLVTYGTAYHALVDRGRIEPGQVLLVLGASGGVGIAAIDLGKALGARVVAAVSSEEKAAICRARGADATIVYTTDTLGEGSQKSLSQQFKAAVGADGAHVVFDPIGGNYAEPALRAIAWAGRYLVIGFVAGIPKMPLNLALLKGCDIVGVFWGAFADRRPEHNARNVRELMDLYERGKIKPLISQRYPLARGTEAIAQLASRKAVGKVLVES
jgi:NADPH:quinone reductase-like Zn-dependent oxidoreductase